MLNDSGTTEYTAEWTAGADGDGNCEFVLTVSGPGEQVIHSVPVSGCESSMAMTLVDGADELDMVINVGWLLAGEDDAVRADIAAVVEAARGRCVKVILETCLLTPEQIVRACELSVEAGATFVKTSTGFSTGGATVEDVALMRKTVGDRCKVKASGGIHNAAEAQAMVDAGADRIGTSSGIAIVAG